MRQFAAIAAVAAAVALSIPAIRYFSEEPLPPPAAVRLSLSPPNGTELGAGDEVLDAAISPDQQQIVFTATRRLGAGAEVPGSTGLWRRRFDAQTPEALAGTEGASLPAWKQTGNVVSFFSGGRLKLLNLKTGVVADAGAAPSPAGATWLRDGSLLFVPGPGPVRRFLAGRVSDVTRLAPGDTAHTFPVAAAAAQDFTYVAVRSDGRRTVRLHSGGEDTDLGTTAAHGALPEPHWLLVVRDTTLLADYRDDDGRMAGYDFPLALDVATTERGRGVFVASADVLLHAASAARPRQITWLDIGGARLGTVADVGDFWQIRASPDERSLAVTARDPLLGSLDVLNVPIDDAAASLRLTTSIAADSDPVWSPDGRRIAVRSMQRGRPEVLVVPATIQAAEDRRGGGPAPGTSGDVPTDWRAGEMLVQRRGSAGSDLVRVQTTGASRTVAGSSFNETDGRWSPDGRWLAYVSDEPGQPDIFVHNEHGDRQRVSLGGGTHPRWTRDSHLLFLRGSTLMRAELTSGGSRFGPPRRVAELPGIRDFDVAHRTNRIVALLPVQGDQREVVSVILNWRSLAEAQRTLMRRKTPPKF